MTATARLAALIGDAEVIEHHEYALDGGSVIVATLVGDPDSDGDDYYAEHVAVAWDAELDRAGEPGACLVAVGDLATWLSRRWPCTVGAPGFGADGQWYADARRAVRS